MEVIILGSGTGFPTKKRAAPGILVRLGGRRQNILLDSGPGTMRQLAKLNLSTNDIDTIMYTHLHPDHTVGLINFLFCAKYQVVAKKNLPAALNGFIASGGKGFRTKPLHLIGPVGFKKFHALIKKLYGRWVTTATYPLTITEVKNRHLKFKGWDLKSGGVAHEKNSIGYRIKSSGKVLVYSGDTAYCKNIVHLAKNADLLILECSTSDEINLPYHLTPRTVAQIARESRAKKVVLTHIYEVADQFDLIKQVKRAWPKMPAGRVKLTSDLMHIRL